VSLDPITPGRIKIVHLDGVRIWKLQCPQCGQWGEIDEDQLHGRVSVDHSDGEKCTFHETRDWFSTAAYHCYCGCGDHRPLADWQREFYEAHCEDEGRA
jgi:hypothetical protein